LKEIKENIQENYDHRNDNTQNIIQLEGAWHLLRKKPEQNPIDSLSVDNKHT